MNNRIAAPIVQLHIDYMAPLSFDEQITIIATLHWCTALRLNFEFTVLNHSGKKAASGYSVQLLTRYERQYFIPGPGLDRDLPAAMAAGHHCMKAGSVI